MAVRPDWTISRESQHIRDRGADLDVAQEEGTEADATGPLRYLAIATRVLSAFGAM